ncbi:hypothetical protein [Streptomyces shenzhenensis]|uniref:hypothetical protein n=1 Tax=Streptomyces shenzhenensis TaxID=943815 RepID=UPI0015F0E4EB|nr:hypothetical protein [Streptomyces shenzhenensis]
MKTKLPSLPNDRSSRFVVSVAVGLLLFGLVVLFSLLVADIDDGDRDGSSGRCSPAIAGTVDRVTCLPYGSTGTAAAGTNNSRSSAQKQPKTPAAKPPAAPKAPAPATPKVPAAPAVKAPAPPPARLTK